MRRRWFRGAQASGYNPDHMLDPALLQKELTVRNWRAGDRYWPAHSKAPKKIKELLQERKLTGTERKLWPVVVSGQEIVWVRGFPTPARLRPPDGAQRALVIRELASREDPSMNEFARPGQPRTVIPAEQIQKRVREMGRQISDDYRGQTIHAAGPAGERLHVHGRPGAGAGSAGDLPVHQAQISPARGRWLGRGAGDFLQPRARHSRPACAAGGGPGAFRESPPSF